MSTGQSVALVIRGMLEIMENHRLGYESCGMATISEGKIVQVKNVGSVDSVFPVGGAWSKVLSGSVGIGHTRYPSKIAPVGMGKFAHPFIGCDGSIALVHNGTIYDYEKICSELSPHHEFSSYDGVRGVFNDSEVIVHLLEEEIAGSKGNLVEAVRKTCYRLSRNPRNQFLFGFVRVREPSRIYVVSGRDFEDRRKVVVAHRDGFGSVFASYRDRGIDGREPIRFEALKPYVDFERDRFEVLDYDTVAILTKDGYRCLRLSPME